MDKQSQFERVASINSVSRQLEPDELELTDLVAPTEDEMNTLRHVPDKVDWSAYSQCFFHISPSKYNPSTSLTQLRSDRLCRASRTLLRKSPVFDPPFRGLIVSLHTQFYGKSHPISTLIMDLSYHLTKAVPQF